MQDLDVGGTDIPRAELQHPRSFLRICDAFAAEHEHSEADARGKFAVFADGHAGYPALDE